MADGNEQGKWVNLDENSWTLLSILLLHFPIEPLCLLSGLYKTIKSILLSFCEDKLNQKLTWQFL